MKNIGIVRNIDAVGRIVLPIELRKELDISEKNSKVEIFAKGNEIIVKKYAPSCIFCHETEDLIEFCGQKICKNCVDKIAEEKE